MDQRELRAEGVTRRFGGLLAVDKVDMSVKATEIVGLIGPNGAGKTTLFAIVSGFLKPNEGRVTFGGQDITAAQPYQIAELGITRTFQICSPFRELTLLENIIAGAYLRAANYREAVEVAVSVLDEVGLYAKRFQLAGQVSLPDLKRLEFGRALATRPSILLLDEVMAGLNLREQHGVGDIIEAVHARGIGIVLVEHSLAMIVRLAHRVMVLDQGRLIADGSPDDVIRSSAVKAAYMGIDNGRAA